MRPIRLSLSLSVPLLFTLLVGASACGGDDDDDDDDDDGVTIDAAPDPEVDASPGADSGTGDGDASTAKLCGGITGLQCESDDDYCDWEDDTCGGSDALGACVRRPAECEPDDQPVCGCNGQEYANKCEAAQAGEDVADISICA